MAGRLSQAGISASSGLERDRLRLGSRSAPDKRWPAIGGTSARSADLYTCQLNVGATTPFPGVAIEPRSSHQCDFARRVAQLVSIGS